MPHSVTVTFYFILIHTITMDRIFFKQHTMIHHTDIHINTSITHMDHKCAQILFLDLNLDGMQAFQNHAQSVAMA